MNIAIILNVILLIASLLWLAFEPGFEPFIVSIGFVAALITLSKANTKKKITTDVASHDNKEIQPKALEPTEVELVASRFKKVLELMNVKNEYSPYTIAKLAQVMKLSTTGELERIFNAEVEPSFEFVKVFCQTFGINEDWLLHGHKSPYTNDDQTNFDPLSYYSEIISLSPEQIYFVLNNSNVGQTFIVLQLSEFKYKLLQRTWHVSSHVGGGGRSQIYGLYKLIRKLKDNDWSDKCCGRVLEPEQFERLYNGECYPESILAYPSYNNPWWDDFTDIYGKYGISKNYKEWYGSGFTFAQKVVRERLGDEGLKDKRLHTIDKPSLDEFIREMENENN